jgi:hypothetical protein
MKQPTAKKKPAKTTRVSARTKKATPSPRPVAPRRLAPTKRQWRQPRTWLRSGNRSHTPLPAARAILKTALALVWQARRPLGICFLLYTVAVFLFVQGVVAQDTFTESKHLLDSLLSGSAGRAQSIAMQLALLFDGTGGKAVNPGGGVVQTMLFVLCSLTYIWILRHLSAQKTVTARQALYSSTTPLVPFFVLLALCGVQLLPLSIGSYVYTLMSSSGIMAQWYEYAIAGTVALLLMLWSLRMLTTTVFALYIVTLPNMTPRRAYQSAGQLVKNRRLVIWRKIVLLPVFIVVVTSLVMLPFLLLNVPFAAWIFTLVSLAWLPLVHSFLYCLYRELLQNER